MKKIAIIGAGFSGMMTAYHLIKKTSKPLAIKLINPANTRNEGVAYSAFSNVHILNVPTEKMGALADNHEHFLDWVMQLSEYKFLDRALVGKSFLSRKLYGQYLQELWNDAKLTASAKKIELHEINDTAIDLEQILDGFEIQLACGGIVTTDCCVLATGNQLPANPKIKNTAFFENQQYFQNP
jgi:uncharacterized NAD(P)/FAD-binding protein YdhS